MDMADVANQYIEDQIVTSLSFLKQRVGSHNELMSENNRCCDECGAEIPPARLEALPGSRMCINCATRKERLCYTTPGNGGGAGQIELDDYLYSIS